jgi:hypothetical protein
MLQKQAVSPELLELLVQLQQIPVLNGFVLVGGTDLALQLGHRISVDIDLFTLSEYDAEELVTILANQYGEKFLLLSSSRNSIHCVIAGIKVDLIRHAYQYVADIIEKGPIRMVSMQDIAAMKLNAITGNGSRIKDFVDMYFLLEVFSLEQIFGFYQQKYAHQDISQARKSLIYFNDVVPETWQNVHLVKNKQLTFYQVKQKLKQKLMHYENRFIQS